LIYFFKIGFGFIFFLILSLDEIGFVILFVLFSIGLSQSNNLGYEVVGLTQIGLGLFMGSLFIFLKKILIFFYSSLQIFVFFEINLHHFSCFEFFMGYPISITQVAGFGRLDFDLFC
jgi:hypothetical protein